MKQMNVITYKAFTEGLSLLASILKRPIATQTTLLIIDTFAKVREGGEMINKINELHKNALKQKTLMACTGDSNTNSPSLSLTNTPIWCTFI
jgi:hypothetical protein